MRRAVRGAPVGGGKTLLATLLPDAMKSKRAVILVPAQMKRKTLETTWPALSAHFALPLDRITLVSYTQLERAPGDVLDRLQPDLVIADEAHLLKNKDAARTARFLRYFKEHPETRLVAMSGTFTNQSIHDYAHLLRLCLRDGSPLPRDFMTLDEWSEALDVNVEDPRPAGALDRLCTHTGTAESDSERIHVHSTTRDRFRCRLTSTPGVVCSSEGFNGTELHLRRREVAPPPKILAAIDRLRKSWVIGDPEIRAKKNASEEITDDLTFARFLGSWLVVSICGGIGLMALGIRSGLEHDRSGVALFVTFYDIAVGLGWTLLCLWLALRLAVSLRKNINASGNSGPRSKTESSPLPSLSGSMTTSYEMRCAGSKMVVRESTGRVASSGTRVQHSAKRLAKRWPKDSPK
jgi:hypothetical protein